MKHKCSCLKAVIVKWRCGYSDVEWKEVKWMLKFASLLFGSGIRQFDGERSTMKDIRCGMTWCGLLVEICDVVVLLTGVVCW